MREIIRKILNESIKKCRKKGEIKTEHPPHFTVERTRDPKFGDFASNPAFLMARVEKKAPRIIAKFIKENIDDKEEIIEKVDIAGGGFINFFISHNAWVRALKRVGEERDEYGRSDEGKGERILIEFVSANPTGPLHIGHGRGAAIGDILTSILEMVGCRVSREYYINDVGVQVVNLGKSVYLRYLELLGNEVKFPDNYYQGDYIIRIAEEIKETEGEHLREKEEDEVLPYFAGYASEKILGWIKGDLEDFGVHFDHWFPESRMRKTGCIEKCLDLFREKGYIEEKDDALWFKSSEFGDEKNRVVKKRDGEFTYLAADIAYHKDKINRGFTKLINIWGADHHGYVARLKAAVKLLSDGKTEIDAILVQMVNLLRGGRQVSMSTRSGEFLSLKEVMNEVGRDATRFFLLMRQANSHLDFDLELAKKCANENPVYYVQYAHARICSIFEEAKKRKIVPPNYKDVDFKHLCLNEEIEMIKDIIYYPELLVDCSFSLEPHRLTFFIIELAGKFHRYYNHHRIISSKPNERELMMARLFLVRMIIIVLKNALKLLGVNAPERM